MISENAAPGSIAGCGLGLRGPIAAELIREKPQLVQWLEIHPENYVARGGPFALHLDAVRAHWPLSAHGLTLAFGDAPMPGESAWIDALANFLSDIDAPWYSDHLCITAGAGAHSHDLLPLPRTPETAAYCAARIRSLRDQLGIPIAIENVSCYAEPDSTLSEEQFLAEVAEQADARLLLDVNNIVVNAHNHAFCPETYLDALPLERVVEIHIAGFEERKTGVRIDTHAQDVSDASFALLQSVIQRVGPRPVLLERDGNFRGLTPLLEELRRVDTILRDAEGVPL